MVGDKGRMGFKERCEEEELRFRWDGGCEEACDARDTPEVMVAWGRGCLCIWRLAGVIPGTKACGTKASFRVFVLMSRDLESSSRFVDRDSAYDHHLAFEFL